MKPRSDSPSQADRLSDASAHEVTDVLADAFSDYPVMKFVLGPGGNTHDRLLRLIGFFVRRRVVLGGPMLGVHNESGDLLGAAVMTLPSEPEPPDHLVGLRDETFRELGDDCRIRHEAYAAAAKTVSIAERHHHLNMLGVRHAVHGRGYARPLLDAAFQLAADDTNSAGVTLTTETPRNVELYQYFGFEVVGTAHVGSEFQTWGMFKRKP